MLGALVVAFSARAEVRIVEDEVLFSIRAPAGASVFLVGDFNNWNPTLEKMGEVDGRFEVRLFLLPGTYRYKFVVDGNWIADPENQTSDPAHGSRLVLVERAGTLVLGADEEVEKEIEEMLKPSLRYAGAFSLDDGDTESKQTLDVWVSHASDKVDARVGLKTIDESWKISPLGAEILFDRGHVDLNIGDGVLKGFENDSIWSSSDPFHLFGDVGVYGYNAGFERHGVSAEVPFIMNTTLRGVYSDKIGERPAPPLVIESGAFDGFVGSDTPDTLVYRYAPTFEDEDVWGIEFVGDLGSFEFGYTRRGNKGYQPGSLVEVVKAGSSFETSLYTTREFWNAGAGWLRWRALARFCVVGGLGRATGEIRTAARSTSTVDRLEDLGIGRVSETFFRTIPSQTDDRWIGGLEFEAGHATARAHFARSEYEFKAGLHPLSSAVVNDFMLDGAYREERWRATGSVRYLDQDYGVSPDDFHVFTPRRNAWIDHRDKLSVARMVSFDLEKSTEIEAGFLWHRRALSDLSRAEGPEPTAAIASVGLVSRGFLEAVEYVYLRLGLEHTFRNRFFVQWDSRLARYDKPSWGLEDTFFSTYLEAGFRNRWTEVSLGFGFDPVVLDPVVNEYADNGREEVLRKAIPSGLTRSQSAVLGEGLRRQEGLLEDFGAIKLEIILVF